MIQIKIPYATKSISAYGVTCANNQVTYQDFMGLGSLAIASNCMEYKSSACQLTCINDKPSCECITSIWDRLFSTPGEWVWNAMTR